MGCFAGGIAVFVFLAAEKIGRDRNHAALGQFIAQAAQPIGQSENFLNDKHYRRFVFSLRINHEGFDRAIARFKINPIRVPRRTVQSILAKIFEFLG